MDNNTIDKIKICINNARIDLEQGGKYDWNDELQECDHWLKLALDLLDQLKENIYLER